MVGNINCLFSYLQSFSLLVDHRFIKGSGHVCRLFLERHCRACIVDICQYHLSLSISCWQGFRNPLCRKFRVTTLPGNRLIKMMGVLEYFSCFVVIAVCCQRTTKLYNSMPPAWQHLAEGEMILPMVKCHWVWMNMVYLRSLTEISGRYNVPFFTKLITSFRHSGIRKKTNYKAYTIPPSLPIP